MTTIADFSRALHHLFTTQADELAREVGFVRRSRKITGSRFAQSLVFGHLSQARSSLEDLTQSFLYSTHIPLARQSLQERFTGRAAHFMERMALAGLQIVCQGPRQTHAFFQHFSHVYITDSTVIPLPNSLAEIWQGTQAGGLKIHLRLNLTHGALERVALSDGRLHDQRHEMGQDLGEAGSLHLTDLGYFSLERLSALSDTGRFWLSRYKGGVRVRHPQGQALDVLELVRNQSEAVAEYAVQLGQTRAVACRLIAIRVPARVLAERLGALRDWERKHQRKASARRHALCA